MRRRTRYGRLGVLLGAVLTSAVLAGCSSGPDTAAGAAGEGGEITVSMTEFAFTPGPVATGSGPVTFHVTNDGAAPHQLAVSRMGEAHETHLVDTGDVAPGDERSVTVELAPGTYEIACHVPGHFESGMVTTLTVVG